MAIQTCGQAENGAGAGRWRGQGLFPRGCDQGAGSAGHRVDIVVGTSAGSVVGSLYAAGYNNGFELQKMAMQLEQDSVGDFVFPAVDSSRAKLLQNFINKSVQNRPIENSTNRSVPTDLQSGERGVPPRQHRHGGARIQQRSRRVSPVNINGRDYVDGGLTSPVPVAAAREMGAIS